MQKVMLLIKYNDDQKAQMLKAPSDRVAVSKKAVEHLGGKPIVSFGTYGEYDMVFIYEMPDATSLAANLHLVDGFGVAKATKIIPLISAEEFFESQSIAAKALGSYSAVK